MILLPCVTVVSHKRQIYRLLPLTTRPPVRTLRSAIFKYNMSVLNRSCVRFVSYRALAVPQILHVNIRAEPRVVAQIPADVIRVVIDHNVVTIPEPAIHKAQVVGGDAEIESVEEEPVRTSTSKMPNVAFPNASREAAMLKRTVEMVMRVVAAGVMSNPLIVGVNVGSFGMACLVGSEATTLLWIGGSRRLWSSRRSRLRGRGAVRRNMSASDFRLFLRQRESSSRRECCK
jgi:hypothetical protein